MSSKRRIRRRSCSRKVRHVDREQALAAMRRVIATRGFSGPMDAYRCRWCGGWHFGHRPRH